MDHNQDIELHDLETIEENLSVETTTPGEAADGGPSETAGFMVISASGFMVISASGFMVI